MTMDDKFFKRIPEKEQRLLRIANFLIYVGLTAYAIGLVTICITLYYGSF